MIRPNDVHGFIAGAINDTRDYADKLKVIAGAGVAVRETAGGVVIERVRNSAGVARAPMAWDIIGGLVPEGTRCKIVYYLVVGAVKDDAGKMIAISPDKCEMSVRKVDDVYASVDSQLHEVYEVELADIEYTDGVDKWLCVVADGGDWYLAIRDQTYTPAIIVDKVEDCVPPQINLTDSPRLCMPIALLSPSGVMPLGVCTSAPIPYCDSMIKDATGAVQSQTVWRVTARNSPVERSLYLQLYKFDACDIPSNGEDKPPNLAADNPGRDGRLTPMPAANGDWSNLYLPYRKDYNRYGVWWRNIQYINLAAVMLYGDEDAGLGATIREVDHPTHQVGPRRLMLSNINGVAATCDLDGLAGYQVLLRTGDGRCVTVNGIELEAVLNASQVAARYLRCSGDKYDDAGNLIGYVATGANQYKPLHGGMGDGEDLTGLEGLWAQVQGLFNNVKVDVEAVTARAGDYEDTLDALEDSIDSVDDTLDALEARIEALEGA